MHPQHWIPEKTGTDFDLKDQTQFFKNVKNKISLITGMEVKAPNNDAHGSGPAGILSGVPILGTDGYIRFGGPSLDQIVAAEKAVTRFRS